MSSVASNGPPGPLRYITPRANVGTSHVAGAAISSSRHPSIRKPFPCFWSLSTVLSRPTSAIKALILSALMTFPGSTFGGKKLATVQLVGNRRLKSTSGKMLGFVSPSGLFGHGVVVVPAARHPIRQAPAVE